MTYINVLIRIILRLYKGKSFLHSPPQLNKSPYKIQRSDNLDNRYPPPPPLEGGVGKREESKREKGKWSK